MTRSSQSFMHISGLAQSAGRLAPGSCLLDRISTCPYVQEKEGKEAKKESEPLAAQSVPQHSRSSSAPRLSHRPWKTPLAKSQSLDLLFQVLN